MRALRALLAVAVVACASAAVNVKMFTVGSPCQSTQAAMWAFHKSTAGNGITVHWAYDAVDDDRNGIQAWRDAFQRDLHAAVTAKDDKATCFADLATAAPGYKPSEFASKAGCPNKLKAIYEKAVTQCVRDIDGYTAPGGATKGGFCNNCQLSAGNNHCALACALAVSQLDRVPSCSIAVADGVTYMAFSGSEEPTGLPTKDITWVKALAPASLYENKEANRNSFAAKVDVVQPAPRPNGQPRGISFSEVNMKACSEDKILNKLMSAQGFKGARVRKALAHIITEAAELEEMLE